MIVEADGRRKAPAWWWPFVGVACLLSLLLHGYTLHGGDNDFWLPVIEASAHSELYPGDPHVTSGHRNTSLHFEALAPPVRVLGLEWAMFAAYLGAHALLFGAFASIARSLVRDTTAAALSVLLLILARPLGGTATLTAVPAFAALALRPVVLRQGVAAAVQSLLVGGLVGSPVILRYLAHRGGAGGLSLSNEEWWAITRRVTSFPFTDLWSDAAWLAVLATAALLLIGLASGARAREGAALLLGPLLVMLVGTPLVMLSGSVSLVALQPMRALFVVVILALVVALVTWVGVARIEWPWTRPSDPAAVIALWARENTPVTTRFAVPPSMRGFRAISRRTVLLEGTDEANALFSREFAAGFLERSRRFGPAASLEDVIEGVRAGRANVLVLPAGVDAPGLERIHSDEHFAAWGRMHP